ncbi:Y4yA family PLP-dependent enzyme [Streptomyces lavendofoliae]|uniref:Diaminopimelate decarboxylase n=1 Tax=Streptomyces lavendofoliae TaxID=67314 RepID=A0A918HY38_9ACTN|nr:Y4yA family PLP-dependent enzyme [Streptomyces lavendofoliae]GGU40556.1 diaminopimelate decarboxylase [Streptomyces lavendofoliae]
MSTAGTNTAGTNTAGTNAAGADMPGTGPVGAGPEGADTPGRDPAGTDVAGAAGEPLHLEPRLEQRPAALLEEGGTLLHALVDALGSPLNVVLPDQIAENAERFRAVFRRHRLTGRIFYAHKANRSSALVRRLVTTDAGLDAASLGELQHALASGWTGDRIMTTGPKDPEFLWLAARAGAVVNADGPAEVEQAARLVRAYGLPRLRVVLRLSGFDTSGTTVLSRRSRFGTPARSLKDLLDTVDRHRDAVEPTGVGYHLDTTSLDEKAAALEGCLHAMEELRARDFSPRAVDVGGGFGISYLAHAGQWDRYTTALTQAVMGRRPPMTWDGHGYGLRMENGTLKGALGLYPAHRHLAGAGYLDELLSRPAPTLGGRPLGTLLLEGLHELYAEPGRALTDQCGLTLGRVLDVRAADRGEHLVRLAMNAGDAGLEDHGVLVDPVVLPRDATPTTATGRPAAVHLMGNLCLESDLITRRTVHLPRLPRPGDLLAFPNTAGYCMDFGATHAQRQPVARKVAVHREGESWHWCLDEQYWPITRPGGPRT